MGINLTQAFVFETDDLKSLDIMLGAALKAMMPEGDKKYYQLWLRNETPLAFQDRDHYPTASVLEIDKKQCVVVPERVYHGAAINKVVSRHDNLEDACGVAYKYQTASSPSRLFVCTVGGRRYGVKPQDRLFENHEQLIWEVICRLRGAVANKKEEIRHLSHPDEDSDGYRMEAGPGQDDVTFSLVKIYYSK